MSNKLFGDRPIDDPSDDVFGMSSFANALATSLLQMSPKDGLVVSVEGPWGSGKSSAIALTMRTIYIRVLAGLGEGLDELEKLSQADLSERWLKRAEQRNTHIVRFNPWNFSGQENLVRAFFSELGPQIGLKADSAVRKALGKLAGYLPSAAGMLGGAAAMVAGQPALAGPAAGAALQAGNMAERALKLDDSLEGAKAKLSEALLSENDRIIVIIDDLDRLMPSEMRAVFSLVKSLGDLPNILYLLSFDEEVVIRSLQEGSEKIDPEFLEKIVQVSLKLPPPWAEELRRMLHNRLNAIIGDATPPDQNRWQRMLIDVILPYLKTPRDVTRLVNTIQVIWPNVDGDVDLTDLIALTVLQLFDPAVYALIKDEIEIITHANFHYEDDKKFGERVTPKSANNSSAAKDAMSLLFPRIAKAWNVPSWDGANYIVQKEQRRLCTKEYHRNYFAFGRDNRRLTRSQIESVIWSPKPSEALQATIQNLTQNSDAISKPQLSSFLEQVMDAVHVKPFTLDFIKALIDESDNLIKRGDVVYELFSRDNFERIESIFRFGIEKLDPLRRSDVLDVLVLHPTGLQIRAQVVEAAARDHGLFNHQAKHESEQLFDRHESEEAATSIRNQIAQFCESGEIWNSPKPMRLIWAWWRMSDKETLDPWFRRVLDTPQSLLSLAKIICNNTTRTGGSEGRVVSKEFDRKTLSELFDVDAFVNGLEELAKTNNVAAASLTEIRKAEENADRH